MVERPARQDNSDVADQPVEREACPVPKGGGKKGDNIKISIRDLRVVLGGKVILDDINLDIPCGKTMAVMGLSGMGKSTLIRTIIRLLEPESGQIIVNGRDIIRMEQKELYEERHRIGMVFQKAALLDSLTIAQNVGFGLAEHTDLSKEEIHKIVLDKLAIVDLDGAEDKMPNELSGGMQKRASLARAISTNPEIMLYDEPTSGLDPIMSNVINRLIMDLQQRFQVTSILVTHDLASAYMVADEIAMLHEGKIIEHGTAEDFKNSKNPVVRQFIEGSVQGPIKV